MKIFIGKFIAMPMPGLCLVKCTAAGGDSSHFNLLRIFVEVKCDQSPLGTWYYLPGRHATLLNLVPAYEEVTDYFSIRLRLAD